MLGGYRSLYSITGGHGNSGFGYTSLYSNNGNYNSAFGFQSLYSNTTNGSSAFGSYSLYSNTIGTDNSAFGLYSLYANISGGGNSGFGVLSLYGNISGNSNSAFGFNSLYSSAGDNNSAFGYQSLRNTIGSSNSALGYFAGYNLTTGSNNTFIGNGAQPSAVAVSNEITLGNASVTTLRCQVTSITALSDARDKTHVTDLPLGLDFLMRVKPRLFNWDRREWYEDGKPDRSKMENNPTAGFIAQELAEAQTEADAEWLNLVLKSNPDRLETTPGNLLPIIVKAIQQLKMENEALKSELIALRTSIAVQVRTELRALLLKAADGEHITKKISAN